MNDPRANMDGNNLFNLGKPRADYTRTPGRAPGFWLSAAGFVLAVVFPFPAIIVAVIGLTFTMQAYRVIPVRARGRGLVLAALGLSIGAIALVLLRSIGSLF
ncbi:hypothetical protein D6T64_19060 [Cryobacterium melibiosiphilum]|uniref:DUF4190 domain-containing protein n=1 Tax=Cryobacterium melibiosiphilum TaxID=995039 RepID=A0A3A5MIG1_9MICO|nr:hypothetical protein [Cryobacterium melibiosiphilum]RJT85707.1 hypothetical protein D6T64_19060 [Cryobacterium melibiosiphilum]